MTDLFGNAVIGAVPISRDLIADAVADQLRWIRSEQLASMLTSKIDAVVEFGRLCNGDKAGQKISLLFNPHRLDTATCKSVSLIEAMQSAAFCSGLARALAWKDGKVSDLLYQCLQLGINGVQYVNEFPPHVAREIYTAYGAQRILDPCAGWGGRMIGAASVGAFYHGFEPSTRTHHGLILLGEFLKSFKTGFDYRVDCQPFEDAYLSGGVYDLAFTSPPYYDTEHYSDESTQARRRYQDYGAFERGFLLPMIEKSIPVTRHGVVVNIGSRRYPMRDGIAARFPRAEVLTRFRLSGSHGLGKEHEDGEIFMAVPA